MFLNLNYDSGFVIAKAFAANGAKVYITGRRLDVLEKAAASVTSFSGSIVPLRMDVTDEEDVKAGAKHIEEIDGKLDILVNKFVYVPDMLGPAIRQAVDLFALNTIAPFFVIRAFQSLLMKGASSRPQGTSSVINISSVAAKMNTSSPMVSVAYSVTKAALDKLTLVLATSFGGRGIPIRVNALLPGLFASEMVPPEFLEAIKTQLLPEQVALIPARRHGSEAEMGMTALYLAVSDYTNGAVLSVDGGLSLVNP
ncbi:NAD(P)-binding protein [Armillaria solidipes]|uniref:NAD(P)-binding protein n=1 Tax=Armillaria solidipes TaxID=1076256 RepID=A0A2H3C7G0_9AGAR|nr:NAD(P)-binding protein [Armillaria solidipes]